MLLVKHFNVIGETFLILLIKKIYSLSYDLWE